MQTVEPFDSTAEPGVVVIHSIPGFRHYNPIGSVHGGYAAILLDSAMGLAVHSVLPAGTGYTTLEFKISFIRGMTKDTGPVRTEGRTLNVGRRAATAEARITDAKGRLLAHATTTCLVFEIPEGNVSALTMVESARILRRGRICHDALSATTSSRSPSSSKTTASCPTIRCRSWSTSRRDRRRQRAPRKNHRGTVRRQWLGRDVAQRRLRLSALPCDGA